MTDRPILCLLAEYPSPDEHTAHARFAELVSQFHFKRAASIRARAAGNVPRAQLYENEAAHLSRCIEACLAELDIEERVALRPSSLSLEELPSLVFAQREHEVPDDRAE